MNDQLITTLLGKLDERALTHDGYSARYAGTGPLTYLSPEARKQLGGRLDRVSVNLARVVVDTLAERLRVTGFTGTGHDDVLWKHWLAQDMDQESRVLHREALILGAGYVIVWANPDGTPSVSVESATQVAVIRDPGTRRVTAAIKRWNTPTGTEATIFEPHQITRLHSDAPGATTTGFRVVSVLTNPLGWVPVVRFANTVRLADDGVSEMNDVAPLADALTKLTTDMLTASEFAARPRRWATGLELAERDILDENGNPTGDVETVSPIGEGDRLMVNEQAEGKFGQLPGSDLGGYDAAIKVLTRQIAAVTGLPDHLLGIGGDNPASADAIRASEAALTARAEARQGIFGRQWEHVARLMVAVAHGADPDRVPAAIQWADPTTRSVAQEADAVVKLHAAGILPTRYALTRLGYTTAELAEIEQARQDERIANATADVTARAELATKLQADQGLSTTAALAAAGLFAAANENRTDETGRNAS